MKTNIINLSLVVLIGLLLCTDSMNPQSSVSIENVHPVPSMERDGPIPYDPTPTPLLIACLPTPTPTPTPIPGTFSRAKEYLYDAANNYVQNDSFANDLAGLFINEVYSEMQDRGEQTPFVLENLLQSKYFNLYKGDMKSGLSDALSELITGIPPGNGDPISSEHDLFQLSGQIGPIEIAPGKSLTSHLTKVAQNLYNHENRVFSVTAKVFIDNNTKTEAYITVFYRQDVVTTDGRVTDEKGIKIGITLIKF